MPLEEPAEEERHKEDKNKLLSFIRRERRRKVRVQVRA